MFDLLFLALLVVVVVLHRKLGKRIAGTEAQIKALQHEIALLRGAERMPPRPEVDVASARVVDLSEAARPEKPVEVPANVRSDGVTDLPPAASPMDISAALRVIEEQPHIPGPSSPPLPGAPPAQDRAIVFRAETGERLLRFVRENWVYVVSAVSLALAGVFLVQYGIEQGLISPTVRVIGAIALGAALILAGEYLRRRYGGAPEGAVAYLPETFSGAGVVAIFAGVMAARQLYGLIGPQTAMAGYLVTALVAIVLGWFNGPFLVAAGLIGATAAPFLVGGESQPAAWLYAYYGLVTLLGLAVDTVRRWAWVSVMALVLGYAGGLAMRQIGAGAEGWILFLAALPLLATVLPDRSLLPRHEGPTTSLALAAGRLPVFPVRLVAATLLVSAALLLAELPGPADRAVVVFVALTFLALAFLIWAGGAEGLADVALVPAVVFLAGLAAAAAGYMPVFADYWAQNLQVRAPGVPAPRIVTELVLMAVAMSLAAAGRSLRPQPLALAQGIAAVWLMPLAVILLDRRWFPAEVIGAFRWALHPIVVAVLLVAMAARFAARDGEDHRRAAHAALAALTMIALSLFILTSATPLTLALSVLVVMAAALDVRFRLPEMTVFIQLGAAVLTWRLLIDPGLIWAADAPLSQVIPAFLGPVAAGIACLRLYQALPRPITRGVVETAVLLWLAVLADTLLARWITDGMALSPDSHWGLGLLAMPWLGLALVQAWRSQLGGVPARLRRWLAVIFGGLAGLTLLMVATVLNPLIASEYDSGGRILGPMVLDTLAIAYLLPALVLFAAGQRMGFLPRLLRRGLYAAAGGLGLLYLGLEIRRFWQGDWLGIPAVAQGELYTYTLALILIGAGLLYAAIARRSAGLRKIAMAVIAVTIAKVFLIDASGLTGLTRVFSFLGLGLSLAGLAWLNRWAGQVSGGGQRKEGTAERS